MPVEPLPHTGTVAALELRVGEFAIRSSELPSCAPIPFAPPNLARAAGVPGARARFGSASECCEQARLCSVVFGCVRLCSVVFGCVRLCSVGFGCVRLGSVVFGWVRLGSVVFAEL